MDFNIYRRKSLTTQNMKLRYGQIERAHRNGKLNKRKLYIKKPYMEIPKYSFCFCTNTEEASYYLEQHHIYHWYAEPDTTLEPL